MKQRVTIQDVARASQASPATVSLVLRNKPGIGGDTRQRVLASASALGYQPRGNGSNRSPQPTRNIGLILRARSRSVDIHLPVVNPFYSLVMAGIEAAARDARMNLLYATLPVEDNGRPITLPTHLLDQPLDGVLLVGSLATDTIAQIVSRTNSPLVRIDAPAGASGLDVVGSDNEGGMFEAVSYLVTRGHRQIGLISPDPNADPNFAQRRTGYLRALAAHGLDDRWSPIPLDDIATGTAELLKRYPSVTALAGSNDQMTLDAMRVVRQMGHRVPDDISLVGFDDIDQAASATPALTTMAVDKVSMGRLGLQTLSHRLAWPDAAHVTTLLHPELIERASVAECSSRAGVLAP